MSLAVFARQFFRVLDVLTPRRLAFLFAALFFVHLAVVWYYCVDLPAWDEWLLLKDALNPGESSFVKFVTTPLWESRISWTYLQVWLLYRWNGWNPIGQELFNFCMYGGIVVYLIVIARKEFNGAAMRLWLLLGILLLTPWYWEAHIWSQQSHIHFTVLFALAAVDLGFSKVLNMRWWRIPLLLALLICLPFTWGRGVIATVVVGAGLSVYLGLRLVESWPSKSAFFRWSTIWSLVLGVVVASVTLSLGLWGGLPPLPPTHEKATFSITSSSIAFFLNLVSASFGFDVVSQLIGAVVLTCVLLPSGLSLFACRGRLTRLSDFEWRLMTLSAAWLLAMAGIALVRSDFPVDAAKNSRYAAANGFLVPVVLMHLHFHVQRGVRAASHLLAGSVLLAVCGFAISVTNVHYRDFAHARDTAGERCLAAWYASGKPNGPLRCETLFWEDMRESVRVAERLGVSFEKKLAGGESLESGMHAFVRWWRGFWRGIL
jgi:hypothetical protein